MSDDKHTPAPWMVGDTKSTALMVYCDDSLGSRIADCTTSGQGITREQDAANVRLIAAAPDLLALARQVASECAECDGRGTINCYESDPGVIDITEPCDACADVRAVIAKAVGP